MTRKIIWALLFLAFFFLLTLTAITLLLPRYIESSLLPSLREKTGISRINVSRPLIGLSRTQASLTAGDAEQPVLSVGSIALQYSLPGLFSRKIEKISISGLELRLRVENNRLIIDDEEIKQLFASPSSKPKKDADQPQFSLPFSLEQLTVEQSTIILHTPTGVTRLPFQARISSHPLHETLDTMDVRLLVHVLEQDFVLQAEIDPTNGKVTSQLSAQNLDLQLLLNHFRPVAGLLVKGRSDVSARATAILSPFSLDFDAHLLHHEPALQSGDMVVTLLESGHNMEFSVGGTATGNTVRVNLASTLPDFRVQKGDIGLNLNSPSFKADGVIENGNFRGDAVFSTALHSHQETFSAKSPQCTITAQATQHGDTVQLNLTGTVPDIRIQKGDIGLNLVSPSLKADGVMEDGNFRGDAVFSTALHSHQEIFSAKSPQCTITAQATQHGDTFQVTGSAKMNDFSLSVPSAHLSIAKAGMTVPFAVPFAGEKTGTVEIKKINWKDMAVAGLTGKIQQKKTGMHLTADINSPLLPGFTANAALTQNLSPEGNTPLTMQLTIPPYQLTNFSLRKLQPAGKDILLSGLLQGQVSLKPESREMGTADFSFQNGSFFLPDKKITVSGIETSIHFPSLPDIRSSVRQKLSFDSASFQDIKLDGGTLYYILESADSFFIEQANMGWVDGSVDTYALRFNGSNVPDKMTFFCSRLNLAALLDQLGTKNVSGDGTVSGRIPVTVTPKKIIFEDSFLYSTPGVGGIIKIGDSDFLTQSIPSGTPQFAQLDFAQAALRNFSYSWAKIHLVSENDMLVMQLQLDGKPAEPLPFSYDSQTGSFKRLKPQAERQGISHPIRLDINFRFPLDTFVDYDKSIKKMLQSIQ